MQRHNHLLRILGIAFGVAVVLGSTVGQGILRSPGVVARASSSTTVIIGLWALGGLISLIGAVAFAELGAAVPRAGGTFAFVTRAFGPAAGAFTGLSILVGQMVALAMMCYISAEYLIRLGVGGGKLEPGWLGLIVLCVFCLVNATGTRLSGMSQVILSVLKVGILAGLVMVLFAHQAGSMPNVHVAVKTKGSTLGIALLMVMTTYGGWESLTYYGEELKDPGRTVPRSLFGGILGITALYVIINLAILHVLSHEQMANSILPAADAAGVVFGERGDLFLTGFSVLSVGAVANLFVMSASRMTFALAREGHLPAILSRVADNGTPMPAIAFIAVVATLFVVTGSYVKLATTVTSITQFNIVAALACVFALRRKEPDLERPYRALLYPWLPLLALIISVVVLAVFVVQDPWNSLIGFALVGALCATDWLAKGWRKKRGSYAKG